jgi:hypothetical protein
MVLTVLKKSAGRLPKARYGRNLPLTNIVINPGIFAEGDERKMPHLSAQQALFWHPEDLGLPFDPPALLG